MGEGQCGDDNMSANGTIEDSGVLEGSVYYRARPRVVQAVVGVPRAEDAAFRHAHQPACPLLSAARQQSCQGWL